MPYDARVICVMIASPGDVQLERLAATAIVHDWNTVHSRDPGTVLLPLLWETHASPAMGDRAQAIINRQLVKNADLLVAMFWTRLGTPTGAAASGTVEEIQEHLNAGKPAMLYFSTAPVRPDSVDEPQFRALQEFKSFARSRGLVEEYESLDEFREKFSRQLAQTLIRAFPHAAIGEQRPADEPAGGGLTAQRDHQPTTRLSADARDILSRLGTDARTLLVEATKDPYGSVLVTESFDGLSVETNARDFVAPKDDARTEARWRGAVRELTACGLLEQRDLEGEVFSVTDQGFRFADTLTENTN